MTSEGASGRPLRRRCRRLATSALALALAGCSGGDGPTPPPVPPVPAPVTPRFQSGLPPGWFGGSSRAGLYEVGIDVGVRRSGTAAAYLTARGIPTSGLFSSIGQSVSAVSYRGKRLRLSAWVRADSISGDGAGLWMRVDGATRALAFDNMIGTGRAIRGTSDWVEYAVVLDVPEHGKL